MSVFVMLALLGFFLTEDQRYRSFMIGLWGAYILYSLIFNYHAATHDYYQLPFIPIVAVSLAPVGGWFFARLAGAAVRRYQRFIAYAVLLLGLFMVVWNVRNQMKAVDFRSAPAMWAQLGEFMSGSSVVGLVGDYAAPLEYWGWRTVALWPYTGDVKYGRGNIPVDDVFQQYARRELFLVTDFEELARQPELKEILGRYPVVSSGDGYIIYDLRALD